MTYWPVNSIVISSDTNVIRTNNSLDVIEVLCS